MLWRINLDKRGQKELHYRCKVRNSGDTVRVRVKVGFKFRVSVKVRLSVTVGVKARIKVRAMNRG